jgi:replicative DNA helicase
MRIDQGRGITMSDIAARARKYANALARNGQKLEIVVVDHIGLVRPSTRYAGNRVREVAEISDGLATLAKDRDCAVVGLCQLNRAVGGRDELRGVRLSRRARARPRSGRRSVGRPISHYHRRVIAVAPVERLAVRAAA